ncbi:helix-turn-helix transcriptional regulator [Pelomonas sp. Root1444]|uniref:helix-turn-helix domain-containing protein n=1 Tax=Pelomonas sp. Root1444 TaxID=1736464 RepID=UPI0009EB7795
MPVRPKNAPKPGRPKGYSSLDEGVARAFGRAAKARRLQAGMSQEALALETGIERSYISRLERGLSQPSLLALLKLARGLGCESSELVGPVEKIFKRRR